MQQNADKDILENCLHTDNSEFLISTSKESGDKGQNNNNNNNTLHLSRILNSTQTSLDKINYVDSKLMCFINRSSENAKENISITNQDNHEKCNNKIILNMEDNNVTNDINMVMVKESAFKNMNNSDRNINGNNDKSNVISKCYRIGDDLVLPLSNDDNQEYAFLQVESVHSYSKASRLGNEESTNTSSQDEDYDDDDDDDYDECNYNENGNVITNKKMKKYTVNNCDEYDIAHKNNLDVPESNEEKQAPDHHARRPMNAFLIFCKRHRAIVREKYKNLENRSITKILGDWWATLSTEEKACYTNLAKQYKDAFFSANPNFKWYKLPAPPLRTLNTRPSNVDRSTPIDLNHPQMNDYENITNENTYRSTNKSSTVTNSQSYKSNEENETKNSFERQEKYSNVGIFKLADETQMGGLNSLITNEIQQQQQQNIKISDSFNHFMNLNKTVNSKIEYVNDSKSIVHQSPNISSLEQNKERIVDVGNNNNDSGKRKAIDDDYDKRKSVRACKGKKYQEFISSGQITPFVKKLKPKSLSLSFKYDYDERTDVGSNFNLNPKTNITTKEKQNQRIEIESNEINYLENNCITSMEQSVKQFDASDFDLEGKIRALPAQNLENYLQRKRDTKKKKKFNSKRQNPKNGANKNNNNNSSSINNNNNNNIKMNHYISIRNTSIVGEENHDQLQMSKTIVGSQKRKARKESITRRDINSMINVDIRQQQQQSHATTYNTFNTSKSLVRSENEKEQERANENRRDNTTPMMDSLHLLNILAEVAATHVKGEKT